MAQTERDETVNARRRKETRPIVRDYSIVSLAALLLMTLLLVDGGFKYWSVLPLLVGAIGILTNWLIAPVLVLLNLMVLLLLQRAILGVFWRDHPDSMVLQILLPAVTLAYLAGSTRLLSLVRHAVPPDPRRARKPPGRRVRGRWLLPIEATTRTLADSPGNEIGRLLLCVPLFLSAAYLIWSRLSIEMPPNWFEAPLNIWRLVVFIWGGAIVLAASWAFLAYLGRSQASVEESVLFLQDQLWGATRGEQRQINRVITRTRLRRQRKEEGS
jgi:hypothetical protein